MKYREAIQCVLDQAGDALIICANGMISREAFAYEDRAANFYMLGSMGLACSIGLGLAMSQPTRRVIVLDGDGNVLSGLGTLAMVGDIQPPNLVHVVIDNNSYGSTGGQRCISDSIALERLALAAGYNWVRRVSFVYETILALNMTGTQRGPSFILAEVELGFTEGIGRVSLSPQAIAERFMEQLL